MPERNLCVESGCKALCCHGPQITFTETTEADILKWFPKAKKISWRTMFGRRTPTSVYYLDRGHGQFYLDITGPCPNLDSNFNCSIQEGKPQECKDFGRGQDNCNLIRLDAHLETFRQWDFEQSKDRPTTSKLS
jgi:Fe-S-cluster containining protein